MVGFLHGIKPLVKRVGEHQIVQQINDMLARLQRPKPKT